MGPIIGVIFIFMSIALWAFLKLGPESGTPRQIFIFNAMVLGLCLFIDLLWYVKWYLTLKRADLLVHLPLLGLGGAFGITTVLLLGFLLVRNFFVFRGAIGRPGAG